jgi:hypothetical protein
MRLRLSGIGALSLVHTYISHIAPLFDGLLSNPCAPPGSFSRFLVSEHVIIVVDQVSLRPPNCVHLNLIYLFVKTLMSPTFFPISVPRPFS